MYKKKIHLRYVFDYGVGGTSCDLMVDCAYNTHIKEYVTCQNCINSYYYRSFDIVKNHWCTDPWTWIPTKKYPLACEIEDIFPYVFSKKEFRKLEDRHKSIKKDEYITPVRIAKRIWFTDCEDCLNSNLITPLELEVRDEWLTYEATRLGIEK